MTSCNRTPESHTVSTPSTTDDFRYRYAKTEMAVLSDRRLTQNDKTVYAVLKAHRNHRTGTAWPSRQLIGQIAGCTDRAVSLATSRLVEAGYLTKESRIGRSTLYGFPLACQPDDTFRGTPERTFTHNLTISNNTKKTPLHQQRAENVVVVVPDAKNKLLLRVGGRGVGNLVDMPAPVATSSNLVDMPAPVATSSNLVDMPAPVATSINVADMPAPVATSINVVEPITQTENALTFPTWLNVCLQVAIMRTLCGLPVSVAQTLLDELDGCGRNGIIKNPVGYLRHLLSLHLSGTLIPEHSDRIAALRASQARNQAAIQRALNLHPGGRPPDTPPQTQKRDQSARLREMERMRQALGMRETGAG